MLESRPDLADGGAPCAFAREIRFEGVGFSYGDKPVLKNLNLRLQKGERVALVGLNGCGKTTLVKLLLRLYDPTEGRILMDGRDIRDFDLRAYRAMFAAVFQDFQLYALTVEENVSLGEEGAARRAGEALRLAGLALDPSRELTRAVRSRRPGALRRPGAENRGGADPCQRRAHRRAGRAQLRPGSPGRAGRL